MKINMLSSRLSVDSTIGKSIFGILFLLIFIAKEVMVPLKESSRGLITEMFVGGTLPSNYGLFGIVLEKVGILAGTLTLGTQDLIGTPLDQHSYIHIIYLTSGLAWIGVYLTFPKKVVVPAAFVFLLLFLNPYFWRFDSYAWRQSLSLALFVIGIQVSEKRTIILVFMSLVSATIHAGILPVIGVYVLLRTFGEQYMLPFVILVVFVLTPFASLIHPLPVGVLPDNFPYVRMLTLEDTWVDSNLTFNNIHAEFLWKYGVTAVVPLVLAFGYFTKPSQRQLKPVGPLLLIALTLPLSALNFIPGANRLIYYFFTAILLYGGEFAANWIHDKGLVGIRERSVSIAFFLLVAANVVVFIVV